MSRIYLLSTLPMLRRDSAPGITPEAFLAACREQLSAPDAQAVEALLKGTEADHPFVRLWRDRDAILRNTVARERARAAGKDVSKWLRPTQGCDLRLQHLVEAALQEKNPLLKEQALDQARWITAEELAGPDPLSENRIFTYAIQLAIVVRWQARKADKGREAFEALTDVPITL